MAINIFVPVSVGLLLFPTFMSGARAGPSVTLTANGESILAHPGEDYVLEWSSGNASSCTVSYEGQGQRGSYPIAPNTSGGARSGLVGWYTLKCIGSRGQSAAKTAIIADTPGPWPTVGPGAATVDEEMAPFIVAGGAGTVRWLQGHALGEVLYGSDAHQYLHRIDQAATGDPVGREEVGCVKIPRANLAVVLIAGQSNAANSAQADASGQYYSSMKPIYNLNIGDGKCYVARNPILGSDAPLDANQKPLGQSFALPLASALIDGGLYERVVLVPIAVSGTLIEQWIPSPPRTPGASHFKRLESAIKYLKGAGLSPTFILWHQGEGNSGAMRATLAPDVEVAGVLSWMRNFFHIVAAMREMGVDAPVFVAKATICGAAEPGAAIRKAQESVVDPTWKIFPGPDTDAIGFALRRTDDYCHFSHEGNLVHAQKWYEVLRGYDRRPLQRLP